MTLAATSTKRPTATAGEDIKLYTDGSGRLVQAVAVELGDESVVNTGNALPVRLENEAGDAVGTLASPVYVTQSTGDSARVVPRWGVNDDIDTGVTETVRAESDGTFPWPADMSAPGSFEVDGGTAGAVLTVKVVRDDFTIDEVDVLLTGGTVTVDTDGAALDGVPLQAWVSGSTAIGTDVILRKSGAGATYLLVTIEEQQTEACIEVVPANTEGYLKVFSVMATVDGYVRIRAMEPGGVERTRFRARVEANRGRTFELGDPQVLRSGIKMPAGSWVEIRYTPTGNNCVVSARFLLDLVDV